MRNITTLRRSVTTDQCCSPRIEESPCLRGSSRTNLQVFVLVLVLEP